MRVAERYGQLPETIENEMSEYWFNRTLLWMATESELKKREYDEMKKKTRR